MTNHGRPSAQARGSIRRVAIRAFLCSTVAFAAFASVLLLTSKFRGEVPAHKKMWPINGTPALLQEADGFNKDANTAFIPLSVNLPLDGTQGISSPAAVALALNAEPAVVQPLSSGLSSASLGIDTLTTHAAAPVPEAHVYFSPELASSETRAGGPSLKQQRLPTPAQSIFTTYEILPKYTPPDTTVATPAASGSSAGLHNASHQTSVSFMAVTGTQHRRAASATATTAAIAEPCPLRPVYVRRPLNEMQAKSGVPEPTFEPRTSCSHTLIASEVMVGIFHCARNEDTRLKSLAETWAPSLLRVGKRHYDHHPNDLRAVLLASKGGIARTRLHRQPSRFPPSSLVVVDEDKDDYSSTLSKGLLGLLGMYERFPAAKWFAVTGDDVFVDPQALTTLLSAFDHLEEWCLVDAGTDQKNKERNTAGSAWRIYGGAPVITSNALTRRLVPFLKAFSASADRSLVHDVQFTRLMGLHGGGFAKITHLDGTYSQGPGVYLGCPGSKKGSRACPINHPRMPKEAAPSLLPRELTGAQWRPASFHHITSDGYMRHLQALFAQAHACDVADTTLAQHQKASFSSSMVMIGRSSKLGSNGRDALRGLVIGIPRTDKEHSPFGWSDVFSPSPEKNSAQMQQQQQHQRGQAFLLDMAKAQKKQEKMEKHESKSIRKMGRNSKKTSIGVLVKKKVQSRVEHRPEALLVQLVEGHPEALWYLVTPFEDAYIDLRGAHLLVEKLCTGDFFLHGQSEGPNVRVEHVFQSLASNNGASSLEACTAAAAVPQLVVVGGGDGSTGGGDFGLSRGTPFLASRGLAHMPLEQLKDLLGSSSAATRLTAAGIAVHLVPADHLALSDLAKHQQQTRANGTFTAKPFCAPVLSTKADLSGMRFGYREAPRVLAHQVLRVDPTDNSRIAIGGKGHL